MDMLDNFDETLNAIRRFIYANVPDGIEYEKLERLLEGQTHYFPLEFRRDDVSCTLYIELDGFAATSITDEQGNRWRQYALSAKPSWPSLGSVEVEQAAHFVALLAEVTAFATSLLKQFNQPITKLVETAEQIAERKRKAAEDKCRADVQARIRANMKGMRVGQERQVECPDLLPIGEVTVCDGPRHYTAFVTANQAFFFTRTA